MRGGTRYNGNLKTYIKGIILALIYGPLCLFPALFLKVNK